MSAREEILRRARAALADVDASSPESDVPVEWTYGQPVDVGDVLETFIDRLEDYKATVNRCGPDEIPAAIAAGLEATGAKTVIVPTGVDDSWLAQTSAEIIREDSDAPYSPAQLNEIDAVVSACAVAASMTGTIILDHGPDQGRRALSLVPDRHICVVRVDQVVSGVPEAVARLRDSVAAKRPQTWISGPSATSDIELERVEGVHGPRQLYVVIAG
ncbi:LUD domain-containing protein [Blastococcus sp. Marseille-P5729]|uniref:LutC/YkgG family protein n=1 Tax=Blastococcus sp. Marseille-P5729 TaxID=2086582 RepID=UPI000D106483|nr:LUD domain-containing protein [Blastococcus sp. Marseille-P5729]